MTVTETVRRLYDAFASGDGDTLANLLGDTHWVEAAGGPYGGTYRGFGEVAANVFGPIGNDVQNFTAIPDDLLPIGDDRLLSLGTYRGSTSAGPLEVRFAHLFTVAGGQITHVEQFTDTHQWREAVAR